MREGEVLPVYITTVLSPQNFMCQLAEPSVDELPLLMDTIHDYCANSLHESMPTDVEVGMACLAVYSKDNDWYRAEVTEIRDTEIDVFFVDYGNSDTVSRSNIRPIPADLLHLPRLVLPCRLFGVESLGSDDWDEASCSRFLELSECDASELTARVISLQPPDADSALPILTVQLVDKTRQCDVAEMLVNGGYAKRLEVSSFDGELTLFIE